MKNKLAREIFNNCAGERPYYVFRLLTATKVIHWGFAHGTCDFCADESKDKLTYFLKMKLERPVKIHPNEFHEVVL